MPIKGTFSLCLRLGFPCPQLLSHLDINLLTHLLTIPSSPHPWMALSPSLMKSGHVSLAMHPHLLSKPSGPELLSFCPCLSLPPWLWVSFSSCRNPLVFFVYKGNCCCSSKFSLNVTFFAKLPLFFVRAHVSIGVPITLCSHHVFLHLSVL